MKKRLVFLGVLFLSVWYVRAEDSDVVDNRVRSYVMPTRVVWTSANTASSTVEHAEVLLSKRYGQVPEGEFSRGSGCVLSNRGAVPAILLDFGREIHGGVQIGVGAGKAKKQPRVRVRTGESVAEAMAELGERGACNDHAIRDGVIALPWMGSRTIGDTGFRFVRLDVLDEGTIRFESVRAVSVMRPMRRLGSFRCSDERLNQIWETAARTLHLCCQDYIWDGIKRDRLVWQGDMHPEVMAAMHVFGTEARDVIQRSLTYMRETTPANKWMNTMPAYTLWWIRCQRDLWFYTGDTDFLKAQHPYLKGVFANLDKYIGADNRCTLPGFLDWPTQHNQPAVKAGVHALMTWAYRDGAELARVLGDTELEAKCKDGEKRLRLYHPVPENSKAAAAMLSLSGLSDAAEMNREIAKGGVKGVSTFYGYYMMEARAKAGDIQGGLNTIRDYWGGMLDMGATSFWEDFNVAWTNNAFRIDELPVPGKKDIHGDFGDFCYVGFRHSLCHGWSSGPSAWLIEHVLGVKPIEPGCTALEIKPFLGTLAWAEGDFPTPHGIVHIRCEKQADGTTKTDVSKPNHVRIVQK